MKILEKDFNIIKYNLAFLLRSAMLLVPIMLLFYQENGLGVRELLYFQGIFYLTSIIVEIPVGYLSNNISRKHLLLISFSIYMGITLLWLHYHGYFIILVGEILFAISKIIMDNAMSGYLYDYLVTQKKETKMPKYYGYFNFYLALGTAIAAIVGTYLYSQYGTYTILTTELFIISIIIALIVSLPNITTSKKTNTIRFFVVNKKIMSDPNVKYHIMFSGLLTSCSILFALTFQPLIQASLLPVFMFGVASFANHGIRSIAGLVAGKLSTIFNLNKLTIILLVLYSISFLLILNAFNLQNKVFSVITILLICLFIGLQLIFTILHISRLHSFVPIEKRGSIMSVNNLVSRSFCALILISSKFFFDKSQFQNYFVAVFIIFIIVGLYSSLKINKGKFNNEKSF